MRLHDLFLDELADVRADADAILERAIAGRRLRRLAWTAGGVAAAVALAAGGWALAGHGSGTRAVDPATDGATAPASARAVAGALSTAIQDGSLGDVGAPTSWDGLDVSPAGYGVTADWGAPENANDLATLSVVLVHRDQAGLLFGTGDAATSDRFDVSQVCRDPDCQRTDLPDGDALLVAKAGPTGPRSESSDVFDSVVMLDSPRRDLLIFASVRAGSQQVSWPHPTVQDLTMLVEESSWGWQLPVSLQSAGAGLSNYTERRVDPNAPVPAPSAAVGSGAASASPVPPTPRKR